MRPINRIMVHCSASDHITYTVEQIHRDHKRRGFRSIGYHFCIDNDLPARIRVCRPINLVGAGAKGYNTGTIHICVLGLHNFSDSQFTSLADLVSMLMRSFDINAYDVIPHNEVNHNKTCPNFDLEEWKVTFLEEALCRWT